MESKKVKVLVVYRNMTGFLQCNDTTLFIIDECYLLGLLQSLVRQDIERVEVSEYDNNHEW